MYRLLLWDQKKIKHTKTKLSSLISIQEMEFVPTHFTLNMYVWVCIIQRLIIIRRHSKVIWLDSVLFSTVKWIKLIRNQIYMCVINKIDSEVCVVVFWFWFLFLKCRKWWIMNIVVLGLGLRYKDLRLLKNYACIRIM